MRPLLLKAHSRAITHLEFNKEGDLLFTTSKDTSPMVWRTDNGERLGTYTGHTGAVWFCNVNRDTTRLLTASADTTAKLWDVQSGTELFSFSHPTPVRCVQFAHGDQMFLSVLGRAPSICVYKLADDPRDQSKLPILEIPGPNQSFKINHATWMPLNKQIISCGEDAVIRLYDSEYGKCVKEIKDHTKSIVQLQFDQHGLLFITASRDGTARLYDARTLQNVKTYETGRPVNAAAISPIKDHVILGGGQAADAVTTTRVDNSQFKAVLFHMVHQEELGRIVGHFGPIHTIQFSPDGRGYASGAEDGYVRLFKFDKSYFDEF